MRANVDAPNPKVAAVSAAAGVVEDVPCQEKMPIILIENKVHPRLTETLHITGRHGANPETTVAKEKVEEVDH